MSKQNSQSRSEASRQRIVMTIVNGIDRQRRRLLGDRPPTDLEIRLKLVDQEDGRG